MGEKLLPRLRAFGMIPSALILLITVPGAAYGLFVQARLGRIHELNNRELGHAASVVTQTVADVASTAKKWEKHDSPCRFSRDQPYLVKNETSCGESARKRVESASLQTSNG